MLGDIFITVISGDTLEPADSYRGFIGAGTPAGRLTGAVTNAAQYTGENITFPILYISVGKFTLGDLANVLWYIRVRRTGPLAIHNLMEVIRVTCISGFHR